ncbi:MAG: signal recognition particle subunit SRP19/SEC65 family protein [Methanomassiliicoccales archaeon]|jgi:signal recognition particle subunit SRP19|nr:signal recognition particle subunit SRP19/SEC65 family protein [Methanomassiliicoccales archaeon]
MDEEKAWALWPEYFDISLTRAQGRKVRKELAVPSPTTEMISKACQSLGLEHTVEADKAYPGRWYERKGRVMVEKNMPKTLLLLKVGERLVRYQRS